MIDHKNLRSNAIIASAFGLTFSRSLIFERALRLSHSLCWRPENLGLVRVETKQGRLLDWGGELSDIKGKQRTSHLRTVWAGREEVFNVLLDTAIQAYPSQLIRPLSGLLGTRLESLDFVELELSRMALNRTGRPDTVLLDEVGRNLVFIEIKLGANYNLQQHTKYLTLNAVAAEDGLFPGYRTFNLLLAPRASYLKSTKGLARIAQEVSRSGRVPFQYPDSGLAEDVRHRVESLTKRRAALPKIEDTPFHFASWKAFAECLEPGLLKNNVQALCAMAPCQPA